MNTQTQLTDEQKALREYGASLVGKTAQSSLIKELILHPTKNTGVAICTQPQEITAYEIIEWLGEEEIMVTLGGESVYEHTLFNIN